MPLPPGPSAPDLVQTWRWIHRPYTVLEDCRKRFGKTFTLSFVGGRKLVMSSDPEVAKQVFTGDPSVFLSGRANMNFASFFGENSVVVLDGARHKEARRLLMPPFRGERMEAYAGLMRDATLADMEAWPTKTPFPISQPMQRITLSVIYQAVFGIRDVARREELTALMARLMSKTSGLLAFMRGLQIDLGALSPWGRYLRIKAQISDILYAEIAKARADDGSREDILARLIRESAKLGIELTDEAIRDQLLTLVAAGHETTATGLGWTFQFLLSHPQVLARAKAELAEVVGEGPVEAEHVAKLDYLDAVVQESLRLFPPIPIVLRWLSQETEVAGYTLPAETVVCPCTYLLHREPDVYADPLVFQPERLLGKRPGPFEFLSFGGGVRTCVGIGFAYFEMKVILATVLGNAKLRLAGPASLKYRRNGIVLAPAEGTPVVMEARAT